MGKTRIFPVIMMPGIVRACSISTFWIKQVSFEVAFPLLYFATVVELLLK